MATVANLSGVAVEQSAGSERMRRVLDQGRAGVLGQVSQGRQIADLAAQVDRQHRAHAAPPGLAQRIAQGLRRHQPCVGIDVREHDVRADIGGAVGGGQKGHRRHNADVAGADVQGQHRKMQRRGAVAAGHCMGGADRLGEPFLELDDLRAGGQVVGPQRLGDGRDVVILDGLAAVGEEPLLHTPVSSSMARRRSAVSQSSLLSLE